jgi:2-dehydro-3-deoxyphosphogalactonate aldolase
MSFFRALEACPLIAILRGVRPDEILAVGKVLVDAGFRIIEVPLNSPEPLRSIEILAHAFPDVLVGAGTVMTPQQVADIRRAGGTLIVMPHGDPAVIRAAKQADLLCVPGVATPTEAFAALASGADGLKMFPAELLPPIALSAWRAVLPVGTSLLPVGGITPDKIAVYRRAGAAGFGLGSALYKPGMSASQVADNAGRFTAALKATNEQ